MEAAEFAVADSLINKRGGGNYRFMKIANQMRFCRRAGLRKAIRRQTMKSGNRRSIYRN